ncbi:MAG: hypothetical protein JW712_11290 [Dehalococcoidales bacterium]|nr:hypothetical protein [Dehalococcoidales bacterium]
MVPESGESGMDALRRLSRQTANIGQRLREEEEQKAAYEQNLQGVMEGLRGISFSVALNQLKSIADPEIFQRVAAMQQQPDSTDLRKLITELSRNLERTTSRASRENPGLESIANTTRTLAILISLLFSLK